MKKILSIILSLSLITGICSCASADEEITITNTEIKSQNIPANGTIIAALYDGNNALTGVRTYKGSETAKYAEDMAEEIKISETIKVFVWDLETIEPLGKVYGERLDMLPTTPPNSETEQKNDMIISVQGDGHTIVYKLNSTAAAKSLYNQLPLSIDVQNYGSNEKIFYPPAELDTAGAISAEGGAGVLAYFSPWGNVVMYYGDFGRYPGLYELGEAVSGAEHISQLTGTIQINKIKLNSARPRPS